MNKLKTMLNAVLSLALLATFELSFSKQAAADDSIRAHLPADPVSLDPAHADDEYSLRILANPHEEPTPRSLN